MKRRHRGCPPRSFSRSRPRSGSSVGYEIGLVDGQGTARNGRDLRSHRASNLETRRPHGQPSMPFQTRETCAASTQRGRWGIRSAIIGGLALQCLVACRHDTSSSFPLAVGFQPLEPCTAPLPVPVTGDAYPEVQTSVTGNRDGHDWAHSQAYVHAALADVWAAMQLPTVCHIHGTNSWTVKDVGSEPFPMSFVIHYSAGPSFYSVEWEDTYRGGVLAGTTDAPAAYGMRGQKTWGTTFVTLQSISVGARAVQGESSVVALEMVGWLNATDSGQSDAAGMLSDFYQSLVAQIHGVANVDAAGTDGGAIDAGSVDTGTEVSPPGDSISQP